LPKKQATNLDVYIGTKVRFRRGLIEMSQERLGDLLGLTFQQVQKYEKGVNRIGAGRLFEIARILGVNVEYFYEGIEEQLGKASRGFAEESEMPPVPPVMEFASSSEGIQLNSAFIKIKDPKIRKQVLDLVKSLADGADK
jgi:transcriptional regulator with XRE-family HTH domain